MTPRDKRLINDIKFKLKIISVAYLISILLAIPLYYSEITHPSTTIKSLGDSVWLIFTGVSTIGFGSVYPETSVGKAIVVITWIITKLALLSVVYVAAMRFALGRKGGELTTDERLLMIEQELKNVLNLATENNKELIKHIKEQRADIARRGDYFASSYTSLKDICSCKSGNVIKVVCSFNFKDFTSMQSGDLHLILAAAKANGVKHIVFPDHEIDVSTSA